MSMNVRSRVLVVLVIMLFLVMIISSAAYAQRVISISTTFSGIVAMQGEKVTFPMRVENTGSVSKSVDLHLSDAPEGWPVSFTGHGSEIHQVYVSGNSQEQFNFEVEVPEDVEPGDYRFIIEGQADGLKSSFPIIISIKESRESVANLTTDYPVLSGPSGTEFKYRVNLSNNSAHEQIFSLFAEVPTGWVVVFQPSFKSEQIASISLDAGATQGLDVTVKTPKIVEAGEYPINIKTVGSLTSASLELKAVITGTYDLNVTTPTGRLNARVRAGEETPLTLLLENRGSAELRNVILSASAPRNWLVTFEPEKLALIRAGESVEVTAFIRPDSKAIAGDYVATFRARSDETAASADFRVTILTPTIWGILGVVAVIVVIFGIFTVFKFYGRR
jgi:uncharacterized membrane protein